MTKKHLVIVNRNDPKLKLEQLADKFSEKVSFNSSNPSKESKSRLDRTIRRLMDKNRPYFAVYLKAEEKNANVAVIEEKNENSIRASLYSIPGINSYFPTNLFDGAISIENLNNKYSLAKSF